MGGGRWDNATYNTRRVAETKAGYKSSFKHDEDIRAGRKAFGIHEDLDPKKTNSDGDHKGLNIRESLDSDEHPETTPIAVLFDVTGSMHSIPKVLQTKLPGLFGLLLRKGYVEHPQILMGAIGDAISDRIPLQVGQFESDNRIDDNLENIMLEGGGGGGNHESYELGAYFMARHTYTDSYEKRGKKGYLFLIGDERVYGTVNKGQVNSVIGGGLEANIKTPELFKELQEKWEVFYLFAAQGSYQVKGVLETGNAGGLGSGADVCYWRDLLGQNAIILEDANAVSETIALTIGLLEGNVSLDEGLEDLKEVSTDLSAVRAAGKALATVGAAASAGNEVVVASGDDLPEIVEDDSSGAERL